MSDRPIVYTDNQGRVFYRASAVGLCTRALVAAGLGYERSPRTGRKEEMLTRTAAEGHLHEKAIREWLLAEGWIVWGDQHEVELWLVPNKVAITGHTDGFVEGDWYGKTQEKFSYKGQGIVEIKSMSRARFDKWQESRFADFDTYLFQISSYMHATNMPALYVVKRRDDGLVDSMVLPVPPVTLKELKRKVFAAENWRAKGELPPCDEGANKWFCPYWTLHEEEEEVDGEPLSEVGRLQEIAEEWVPRQAEIAVLTDRKKEQSAEVLGLMKDRKKVQLDGFSVVVVNQMRSKFDMERMKKDFYAGVMRDIEAYEEKYMVTYPVIKTDGKQ